MEDRRLPATLVWVGDVDQNWSSDNAGDTNWQGDLLPASGDTLVFSSSGANRAMNNDTAPNNVYELSFTDGGYSIAGNTIGLASASAIVDQSTAGADVVITANLAIEGDTSVVGPSWPRRLSIEGAVHNGTGFHSLAVAGGRVYFETNSSYLGTLDLDADEVRLNASFGSSVLLRDGVLSGEASIRNLTAVGGTVAPGPGAGVLNTLSLFLGNSASYQATVYGPTAGTQYDQIAVIGQINLTNASLAFFLGYAPAAGDSYTIISNDGVDPIVGNFAGLPNGTVFYASGVPLVITYDGGDGNDVVVSALGPTVAAPDVYSLPENTTLNVTLASQGVLANDTGPNGRPLQAILLTSPTRGTLLLNGDGTFTYTPAHGYFGPDAFTYFASDGLVTSLPSLVLINVNRVIEPPEANSDAYRVAQDGSLNVAAPGVLQNDVSPEGTPLSAAVVVRPVHAQSFTFDEVTGAFTYVPAPGYSGTDSFTYRATAGDLTSNVATVLITVDPIFLPPTVVDDAFTATADQTLSVVGPGVLANDVNPNAVGNMTAFLVSTTTHGLLTLAPDGSFNYTPTANFSGVDSFTYRAIVGDAQSATTATVVLTVRPVNHAPIARDDVANVLKNTAVVIDVLANDSDVDPGTTLSAVIVNQPQHGTVVPGPGSSITYIPAVGYTGSDFFTYRASDGSLTSEIATVNVTVNQTNLPPTANNDAFSVPENGVLNVAAPGVLGNDVDPQNFALSAFLVGSPMNGSLVLNANGSFVYTPKPYFSGTDSFTYLASNGSLLSPTPATVTITVNPVATTPTAVADAYATNQNVPFTTAAPGVLANDLNPDRSPIRAVLISGPSNGTAALSADGRFTYTPNPNFFGVDTFTYQAVNDNRFSAPATVTIAVAHVNQAPIATDDAYAIERDQNLVVPAPGVLTNDSDPDGGPITAVLVNSTLYGSLTLNPNGSFTYIPLPGFVGVDTFTYKAADGTLGGAPATVTITVRDFPVTTTELDPLSDTGVSSTDRITRWTTPTFFGKTQPGLLVKLSQRKLGTIATPIDVGSALADGAGSYNVTSAPLPDGQYEFFVTAYRPDGRPTGSISGGPLTIDTVAPRITKVQLTPKLGQMYLTYEDVGAGLEGGSLGRPSNYSLSRYGKGSSPAYSPTNFNVLTSSSNPYTFDVVLRLSKGQPLPKGWYMFTILSGGKAGVQDVAGNGVSGAFTGTLPSGNGVPGDFRAYFNVTGASISLPRQANGFMPVLPPVVKNTHTLPAVKTAKTPTVKVAPAVKAAAVVKAKVPAGPKLKGR